jgi:hypothetical protein
LFSCLRRTVYMSELSHPMAMYMSMIPWPKLYHGASRSRYYTGGTSIVALCCEPNCKSTYDVNCYGAIQICTGLDVHLLRNIADYRKVLTMKWPRLVQHRACTNPLHCLKSKPCNGA